MVGTIPRALVFDPPDGLFSVNGSQRLQNPRDITAFSEPFFIGNGNVPQLVQNCPTSNCTWEPFDTLAVCSRCQDMSQDLQWGCATGPADWLSNVTLADDSYPNVTACGYWFYQDGETVLMSGHVISADGTPGEALETRIFPLTNPNPFSRQPIFGGSLNFKDVRNPILDFLVTGTPSGSAGVYANRTPTLNECV
jgi:hypothetical protein